MAEENGEVNLGASNQGAGENNLNNQGAGTEAPTGEGDGLSAQGANVQEQPPVDQDAIFAQKFKDLTGVDFDPQKADMIKQAVNKQPEKTQHELDLERVNIRHERTTKALSMGAQANEVEGILAVLDEDSFNVGMAAVQKSMIELGFSKDEMQLAMESFTHKAVNLEEIEDEGKRKFIQNLQGLSVAQITANGDLIKKQAKSFIDGIDSEIAFEKELAKQQMEYPAKVADFISSLPTQIPATTLVFNDENVEVPAFSMSNEDMKALSGLFDTPEKAKYFLVNKDGSFNKDAVSLIQKGIAYEKAISGGVLFGSDLQVKANGNVFPPANPGLGGAQMSNPPVGEIVFHKDDRAIPAGSSIYNN